MANIEKDKTQNYLNIHLSAGFYASGLESLACFERCWAEVCWSVWLFAVSRPEISGKIKCKYLVLINLIGMRKGTFTTLVILGLDFVSWISIKKFQTFLEVKIVINLINLTPCHAHWVHLDEHFSYFHNSCQWELSQSYLHLLN